MTQGREDERACQSTMISVNKQQIEIINRCSAPELLTQSTLGSISDIFPFIQKCHRQPLPFALSSTPDLIMFLSKDYIGFVLF